MEHKVVTILEGIVAPEKANILEEKYTSELKNLPPSIAKTHLVHDLKNPSVWRIITYWNSRKDLEDMRSQGTPAGVLMFRAAGSEPTLTVSEVLSSS